jgi:hypothetical protein
MLGLVRFNLVSGISANEVENVKGASRMLVKPFSGDAEEKVVVNNEVGTGKYL